jgi:hypothetical protein
LEHPGLPQALKNQKMKSNLASKIWSYHLLKELQQGAKKNWGNITMLLIKAQQEGYANLRSIFEVGLKMAEQYLNPKLLGEKIKTL